MKSKAKKNGAQATAVKMRTMFQDGCCRVWPDESLTLGLIESDFEEMAKQISSQYEAGEVPDPQIAEALTALSCHLNWVRGELASNRPQSAMDAACRAGATWMALKQKLEWMISPGRPANEVWAIARAIYKKDKKAKQSHICQLALDKYKQQTGAECEMKLISMEKHFRKQVINHR